MDDELGRIWKEVSWSNWGGVPAFTSRDWGKPRKSSVRIDGVPSKARMVVDSKLETSRGQNWYRCTWRISGEKREQNRWEQLLIYYVAGGGVGADPAAKNNTRTRNGSTNKTKTAISWAAAGGSSNTCHRVPVSQGAAQYCTHWRVQTSVVGRNAVSKSIYTAPDGGMVCGWWIGTDLEGHVRGLSVVLSRNMRGEADLNYARPQSGPCRSSSG
jgi:hypothetical protein